MFDSDGAPRRPDQRPLRSFPLWLFRDPLENASVSLWCPTSSSFIRPSNLFCFWQLQIPRYSSSLPREHNSVQVFRPPACPPRKDTASALRKHWRALLPITITSRPLHCLPLSQVAPTSPICSVVCAISAIAATKSLPSSSPKILPGLNRQFLAPIDLVCCRLDLKASVEKIAALIDSRVRLTRGGGCVR
jgi:hypothetical protein